MAVEPEIIPRTEKEKAEISFRIHHVQILSVDWKVNVENKIDNLDGNDLQKLLFRQKGLKHFFKVKTMR